MIADLYHLVRHFPAFLIDKKKKHLFSFFIYFPFRLRFHLKLFAYINFIIVLIFLFQSHFAINQPKEYISISTAFLKHNCGRALIMQIK